LNNIAGVFSAFGTYKEALSYVHRATGIYSRQGSVQGLIESYNNIGLLYYYLKEYKQAKYYQDKGYQLALSSGYRI
jgi:tetratricopeptide (TPR) repeat protein